MHVSKYCKSIRRLRAGRDVRLGLAVSFAMTLSYPAAGVTLSEGLQLHGFASQAVVYTTDNNFFGETDDAGSLDFSELGLNASYAPVPNLLVVGQVISRHAGATDDGEAALDYGFIDSRFAASDKGYWGGRFGRIKVPLGLFNDIRGVPLARPGILLPQSIYFERTRNLAASADGVVLYGEQAWPWATALLEFGIAEPIIDAINTEPALLGADRPGNLQDRISFQGRLMLKSYDERIRLAVSSVQANIDYQPGTADPLVAGKIRFTPWIFSLQYDAARWGFTGEYARRRFSYSDFGPALPNREVVGKSRYVQFDYRPAPPWQFFTRYDVLNTDEDDEDGENYAAGSGLPAHTRYAKDFTLGVRWDPYPYLFLRAEWHKVNGTAWLPIIENPDLFARTKDWQLVTMLVSFHF